MTPPSVHQKKNIFKQAPKTPSAEGSQLMSTLECITPLAYVRRRLTEGGGGVREAASIPSPAPNPTPTPVVPCRPNREHPPAALRSRRLNCRILLSFTPRSALTQAVKIEQLWVRSEVNSGA